MMARRRGLLQAGAISACASARLARLAQVAQCCLSLAFFPRVVEPLGPGRREPWRTGEAPGPRTEARSWPLAMQPWAPDYRLFPARRWMSMVGKREGGEGVLELDVAEARKLTGKMRRERQLAFSFPGPEGGAEPQKPVLFKVFIDQEVRTLLKLAARERKGRILLDAAEPSLEKLTNALEARFPIGAVPYRLQARWQLKSEPGPGDDGGVRRQRHALSLADDEAVAQLFELGSETSADQIRLELHVLLSSKARVKDERASPEVLALIASSSAWCMVSFYTFTPIKHPVVVAEELQREWGKMGIIGRTYVANEGVNAQLAVPDMLLPMLRQHLTTVDPLRGARVNVDTHRVPFGSQQRAPFDALHVRVRPQIVVDGLRDREAGGEKEGLGDRGAGDGAPTHTHIHIHTHTHTGHFAGRCRRCVRAVGS